MSITLALTFTLNFIIGHQKVTNTIRQDVN